jgi:hypothetical protein
MLRVLEAMGVLALLTRQTPKEMAAERERFREVLTQYEACSSETQERMHEYLSGLESRLDALPEEIEQSLNPEELAKRLGESLRQHFLRTGLPQIAEALQASSATVVSAQQTLVTALDKLCDRRFGVLAEVESANRHLTYSVENRAKNIDALLLEVRHHLVRVWVPLLCGATLLIGLFAGISIQR